jgi:hypothetical protein
MEFGFVSIVLLILAGVLILSGLRLLIATGWLLPFLRGFAGFGQILLAVVILFVGLNLASYAHLEQKQDIASVSFKKTDEQRFEATVMSVHGGQIDKFTIDGDMWQISARSMKLLGSSTPFYKLEQVSGRYFTLEQQRSSAVSVGLIADKGIGLDLGALLKNKDVAIVSTSEVKTKFFPMSDGAVYSVSVGAQSLETIPVNEEAKAINR